MGEMSLPLKFHFTGNQNRISQEDCVTLADCKTAAIDPLTSQITKLQLFSLNYIFCNLYL